MGRPASLVSGLSVAWALWTAIGFTQIVGAERYGDFGLSFLRVVALQGIVAERFVWLLPGALLGALAFRLLRRPRAVATALVVVPVCVFLATRFPGSVAGGSLLLRFAVTSAVAVGAAGLVGHVAGRSAIVQRFAVSIARFFDGAARLIRDRLPVRLVAHPAWSFLVPVAAVAAMLLPALVRPTPPSDRSVVVILVDTLRADHLGVYGYDRDTSPNLDRAAGSSVIFERGLSQASWTKPSVASLFSSLHPSVHLTGSGTHVRRRVVDGRVEMVPAPEDALPTSGYLPRGVVTVAELFREAGYRVGGFVANSLVERSDGYGQGFHRYETVGDREVASRGIEWIESNAGAPFFLYLHLMAPHAPYDPPAEFDLFTTGTPTIDIHGSASKDSINFTKTKVLTDEELSELIDQYDGEIRFADALFGSIFDTLERTGALSTTTVVFTADHGEEFMDHGMVWHESFHLYEELVRIPFIWWSPEIQPRRVSTPVMHIDLAPTLLELCGLTPTGEMQGWSLRPLLEGGEMEPRPVFSETRDWGDLRAVSEDGKKLIVDREAPSLELYDLGNDPDERIDLATTESDVRARLLGNADRFDELNRDRASGIASSLRSLSPAQIEKLKSLGYIQ